MIREPYPTLQKLLGMIGEAGKRMSDIDASEGAAGNISVCLRWEVDLQTLFPESGEIVLSQAVPELAGATIIVTGSGRRLREICEQPTANVACLVVNEGGRTAIQYTSGQQNFEKVTSEFNSHLAVHYDKVLSSGTNFHAIIHAQPPYLTFISNIPRYQEEYYLNTHLLRWQPEAILNLSEGIGFAHFKVPGSEELVTANTTLLHTHNIVVWAKHGVMSSSDISVKRATDWIEYAETSAHYEYLNLSIGEIGEGLTQEEIRSICAAYNIEQDYF